MQAVATKVRRPRLAVWRYFVRKDGRKVTGVARVSGEQTVALYQAEPGWSEVDQTRYEAAKAAIWIP